MPPVEDYYIDEVLYLIIMKCNTPWKARASWGKEDGTCKIAAGMKRWRVALVGDMNNECWFGVTIAANRLW
eukprot:scaffold9463_cov140-Skeletonema_menzelii.AAC.1